MSVDGPDPGSGPIADLSGRPAPGPASAPAPASGIDSTSGPFSNEVLDVAALPALDHDAFLPLHPSYRIFRVVSAALGWVVPLVGLGVGSFFVAAPDELELAVLALVGVLLVAAVLFAWFEFPFRGWLMREHDASFRHGIVSRRTTTVPFTRVQHVAVTRGGIERALGLATLDLYTAGSGVADLRIPGLTADEAERLREHVLARTQADA